MANSELTEESVYAAQYNPTSSKVQYLWDSKTTGFGVRLYPSGKKSFVVAYRPRPDTRMKFAVIGKVGQMKVRPARAKAAKILANDEDPTQERRNLIEAQAARKLAESRNPTISGLIEGYYAHQEKRQASAAVAGKGKHLSDAVLQQYRWTINRHILPKWRD